MNFCFSGSQEVSHLVRLISLVILYHFPQTPKKLFYTGSHSEVVFSSKHPTLIEAIWSKVSPR